MSQYDWIVLVATLAITILYGIYRSRSSRDLDGYFLSNRNMPWWLILLSIMGTQASAVTFLAAPGQAYTDGMRFVQFYFGLPLAAIVICITFIPVFHRLKIYTAYEYLEQRFDGRTRTLTAFLFLIQRGLSTGISIVAPSIILSALLDWNIYITNTVMGGLLIIYTVSGGARAVAYTQKLQLIIIFVALFIAAYFILHHLPDSVGWKDALNVSGKLGKLNVITTGVGENGFDWSDRYNIISGVIGGFFLLLSYFGTDQSQVGRYLTAKSMKESRLGLLMNAVVKIPMQFFILLIGALVFSFYQFNKAPIFFNQSELVRLEKSEYRDSLQTLTSKDATLQEAKQRVTNEYLTTHSEQSLQEMRSLQQQSDTVRSHVKALVKSNKGNDNDTNYIFLRFVMDYMPVGLIGLFIAMVFLASWGSIAAALNSLASATVIDIHKRYIDRSGDPVKDYRVSRVYTMGWGVFCIGAAIFAINIGNSLIEAVNILGSLFYGTILGIFLVAFYCKKIEAKPVFIAAIIVEVCTIILFILSQQKIIGLGFLWLNVIGALGVMIISWILNRFMQKSTARVN